MLSWRKRAALQAACFSAFFTLNFPGAVIPEARAQTADEKFYAGRQVTLLIAATAGGGYDRWGRLVSRHMASTSPAIHPS